MSVKSFHEFFNETVLTERKTVSELSPDEHRARLVDQRLRRKRREERNLEKDPMNEKKRLRRAVRNSTKELDDMKRPMVGKHIEYQQDEMRTNIEDIAEQIFDSIPGFTPAYEGRDERIKLKKDDDRYWTATADYESRDGDHFFLKVRMKKNLSTGELDGTYRVVLDIEDDKKIFSGELKDIEELYENLAQL